MIAAWMVYCLLVALLLGGAALAADCALRLYGRGTRWAWLFALTGSLLVPAFAWLAPERSAADGTTPLLGEPLVVFEPVVAALGASSWLATVDGVLGTVWAVGSAALTLVFLGALMALQTRRRSWRAVVIDGHPVLLAENTGPAVLGFFRRRIVVPSWALDLSATERWLLLSHEAEHVRAGDPLLLLLSVCALVVMPWNLALWWQAQRLRLAIEVDCDDRVLRRVSADVGTYGCLLLDVGRRHAWAGLAAVAAFSERGSLLETRIRMMTAARPRNPWVRAATLAAIVALIAAVACLLPDPEHGVTGVNQIEATATSDIPPEDAGIRPRQLVDQPRFTPFTVRPGLLNSEEIRRALDAEYPPLLRTAGVGGTVILWFFIDTEGRVPRVLIRQSSGHSALDEAALRLGVLFRFSPALNGQERVPVWVQIPITFQAVQREADPAISTPQARPEPVRLPQERPGAEIGQAQVTPEGARVVPLPQERPQAQATPQEQTARQVPPGGPVFTPFTVRPELRNRDEVGPALEAEYPPVLRDAGIEGTVVVWVYINETGTVARTQIARASGHEALDQAALRVAKVMKFSPAMNRDQRVAIWIQIPITFQRR